MATPTTSIRRAVKARLAELLAERLPDVRILRARDATKIEKLTVAIGDCRGNSEIAALRAGRQTRSDRFTVEVWCLATLAGDDPDEAEDNAEQLFRALEDVLAEYPTLRSLPGVIAAVLADVDGPNNAPTDDGFEGSVVAKVSVHARLH